MKRDLQRLADETFDVVILGGGIYGLSAAWACALRGLSVGLVERGDFGAATSSGSLKLVHGGLRYLQHLDFVRMRISIGERRHMLRMAPHLVHPLPFLVPCYGHGIRGPEAMRMAMLANDTMSADRNCGLADPARHIPGGRMISADECAERLPGVERRGLNGAAIFWDAQMYNSERLSFAFGLSAAAHGAALANHAEAVGFDLAGGAIAAVRVRDRIGGAELAVRGRVVLNMTGPWCDITLARLAGPEASRAVRRSKGIQLIVRRLPCATAFGVESRRERDKTARIPRGNRSYFSTPWRDVSIIGTTDTLFEGDPDAYGVSEADIAEFLGAFNEAYPAAGLARADVRFWCGGLRPLGDIDADPDHVKASNRTSFIDHARVGGPANLVTVVGVKYTVARSLAEQAAAAAVGKLNRGDRRARTESARLAGGDIDDTASFLRSLAATPGLPAAAAERLGRTHGTGAAAVLALAHVETGLADGLAGGSNVLRAEVVHACREEAAQTLSDIVFRRTDLGTAGHPGRAALEDCAALAARELGWTADRMRTELDAVEAAFRPA